MHVSRKLAKKQEQIIQALALRLSRGEEVLALFGVTKAFPTIGVVAITDHRVLAFDLTKLQTTGRCAIELSADEILGVAVTGFSAKVTWQTRARGEITMGTLLDQKEGLTLITLVNSLIGAGSQRRPPPTGPLSDWTAPTSAPPVAKVNLTKETPPTGPPPIPASAQSASQLADQLDHLERIASLQQAGHITSEEAAHLRQRVLNG